METAIDHWLYFNYICSIIIRGQPFYFFFEGGGGEVDDFQKKISCKCIHMRKKKIPAQDHRPKKISRTYSELEKNYGKMFPVLTH